MQAHSYTLLKCNYLILPFTYRDVSNNSIGDTIPSELPTSISYLNLSHNLLTGSIGDIFTNLKKLSVL
ncbi:hypothetical protein EJ110_NYTH23005 [Nymphaea thermarum]|nr:hypothetical protein EJ110_NYTH23005 [Nymphaea thermarum]